MASAVMMVALYNVATHVAVNVEFVYVEAILGFPGLQVALIAVIVAHHAENAFPQ